MQNVIVARNEIEKKVDEVQKMLQLSELDMCIVLETVLSTARHKALARNAYNELIKEQKGESENGNTNEER